MRHYTSLSYIVNESGISLAAYLVEQSLDLDLQRYEDLETGSEVDGYSYYEYCPRHEPISGIAQVLLVRAMSPLEGWASREQAIKLEVTLQNSDLLEAGRLTAELEKTAQIYPYYCIVNLSQVDGSGDFWRSHSQDFEPRRTKPAIGSPATFCRPRNGSPDLRCQLVMGFASRAIDEVSEMTSRMFDCTLMPYRLFDLPGPCLRAVPRSEVGDGVNVLLRRNCAEPGTRLYESHDEETLLLDIDFVTSDLLHIGRLAAHVEESAHGTNVLAYSVHGDLLRDGIQRGIARRFSDAAEARSTWKDGHSRRPDDWWENSD
ncbi:hypothetical protein ACNOYE_13705 [Nannocystaceae bacterium ST9]